MTPFRWIARGIGRIDEDTRIGAVASGKFIVGVAALAFFVIGGLGIYSSVSSTNELISSGKTPAAIKLKTAAQKDLDLLCAVLQPSLANPKIVWPKATRQVVMADCPVKVRPKVHSAP